MTHKTTMPEPMLVVDRRVNGYVRFTTAGSLDFPRHPDGTKLITTDQAEAYADARVRGALEEAAQTCKARIGTGDAGIDTSDCDEEAQECAVAIRTLIPTTK